MTTPQTADPLVLRTWRSLGGGFTIPDADNGYQLLTFLQALLRGDPMMSPDGSLGHVNEMVRDAADHSGWGPSLDADAVMHHALPWLGQFVGVKFDHEESGLPEGEKRQRIRDREGWDRGTLTAIRKAIEATLTGSKKIRVTERDTSAYHFLVQTFTIDTPDPAATEAAIERQKPAGLQFVYQALTGGTYDDLSGAFATYDDLDAAFATYDDQTAWVPP